MNKILLTIIIVLIIIGAVTAGLLLYPYPPDKSPQADDVGSTQEGIQEVVDANNQFAFELYSELNKNEQGNILFLGKVVDPR